MGCNVTTSQWLAQADELAMAATSADPAHQDAYIFAMGTMLRRPPRHLAGVELSAAQEECMCHFLRQGAHADAAMALVPERSGVMISRAGSQMSCASIRLEGQDNETTATGQSFALAVVSALAQSCVDHYLEVAAA